MDAIMAWSREKIYLILLQAGFTSILLRMAVVVYVIQKKKQR